jgi:haloacetate dehalogenase
MFVFGFFCGDTNLLASFTIQFKAEKIITAGGPINARSGGKGPPLLLLHGHPQSHVMWHLVAPALAEHFSLVMMDLRGYGDSFRATPDAQHAAHSKRAMAQDAVEVMRHFGFDRFAVLAHDRGARVAHRLAADHVEAVSKMLLLDIAPTLGMYANTSEAFAKAYWHWFFLIQPEPLPEALITSDPVRYLRSVMGKRHAGLAAFAPAALAEYERCIQIPGSAESMCEDYRASAGIDLEHDRQDINAGRKLALPVRVLWGEHGVISQCFDPLALWRERANDVSGSAVACGHYIAEELPERVIQEALEFFKSPA